MIRTNLSNNCYDSDRSHTPRTVGLMKTLSPTQPQGRLEVATSPTEARALARLSDAGKAQKIAPGIYAVGATLPLEEVVRLHQNEIVAHVWPGGVYCGISALSAGAPKEAKVFVAHPSPDRITKLKLAGVTIFPVIGPSELPGDIALPGGVFISGPARKLVENITFIGQPARQRAGNKVVENVMDDLARYGGAGAVTKVLQNLDVIAHAFDAQAVENVRLRLASLLGTNGEGVVISSQRLKARIGGAAFDAHRISLFEKLAETLGRHAPLPRSAQDLQGRGKWSAFFESYFSNFIEGTEFGIDEAREIAIDGKVEQARPKDAHDVTATYRLASDQRDRILVPRSGEELIDILQNRHQLLMAARPEKNPGVFKSKVNYAGGTRFVDPNLVEGTLIRGFSVINQLSDPFTRAVGMMALITECHPFDDGNGRVARLTCNAELSVAGQARFIIPTSYRNDYLAVLNGFSNEAGSGQSLIAVLDFAQKWASYVDWSSFEVARATAENCNAFVDPGIAERTGRRLKLPDNNLRD